MNNTVKKVLAGTGVILTGTVLFGTVSYFFVKRMVRIALDRELPRISSRAKQRLSGSQKNDVLSQKVKIMAAMLERSETKTVETVARDGETLIGHLYECENAKRLIIAMHGWRSSWCKDFGAVSEFWHKNHCNVLYVEQRGQNNSGGNYMGFGMLERFDCLSWVEWVNSNANEKLPIYLAGISMGASTVLMASGLNLPEEVCGIMADCGYTSPYEIWKHVVKNNLHMHYGVMGMIANDMCRKKINMSTKDYSTIDAMEENTIPVLFIHGSDDRFVPVEMTYENYKACKAPKKLLIVPGAGHGKSYITDKESYERITEEFWRECEALSAKNPLK